MPSRRISVTAALTGPGLLVGVALVALLVALMAGGGAAALAVGDPGPIVRFGLPAAKLLVNLTAAATIGFLAAVTLLLPPGAATARLLDAAAGAAAVWTLASALTGLLTFLSVSGAALAPDTQFGGQLGFFLTSLEPGRAWLTVTLVAAAVTVLCFAVRAPAALLAVLALAVGGITPLAGQGHGAAAASHEQAVSALGVHLVFAALWLGGVLALVLLRSLLPADSLLIVVRRYSPIALVCFLVVAVSGYVSAALRVGSLDALSTPYGLLVLVKVLALLALAVAGALHRRAAIRRFGEGRAGAFWGIILAEVVTMGVASGAAAALARTGSPLGETDPVDASAAVLLTGEPLPAPLDALSVLTATRLELGWLLGSALVLAAYLIGVQRLRARGETWPRRRVLAFTAAAVLLAATTNGAVAAYERQLFSMHAALLALLLVAVPVLAAAGHPLQLLRRAAVPRTDGSRGLAGWLIVAADSRLARLLRLPLVAGTAAALVLIAALFPPALLWSVEGSAGRDFTAAALLAAGGFVASSRGPRRAVARAVPALASAAAGAWLLATDSLLLADWFGAMGWGSDASADQRIGGAVLLAAATVPLTVLAVHAAYRRDGADQPARIASPPSPRSSIR